MGETVEEDAAARRARLKALRAAADAKPIGHGSAAAEAPVGALPKTKFANPLLDGPSTSQPAGGFYSDPMAQYEASRDASRVAYPPGPPGPPGAPSPPGVPLPPPPGLLRFGAGTRFPPPPPRAAFPEPGRGGSGMGRGASGHPASVRGDDRGRKRDRDDRNMDAYVSKSMVEDPWRHLTTTRR